MLEQAELLSEEWERGEPASAPASTFTDIKAAVSRESRHPGPSGVVGRGSLGPVTMVRGTRSAYFPVLNETGGSDVPRLASAPMSRAPPFLAQSVAGNQRSA